MDLKPALISQYRAGLAMLRQAIERCPAELWTAGAHPRNFWRIAYHAIFYTHFYAMHGESSFQPWAKHRRHVPSLWADQDGPPVELPYSVAETLEYLDYVDSKIDEWVNELDLSRMETGFDWYPIPKLDHQLMNVRHLQGHVGQISELLMAHGVDVDWIAVTPDRRTTTS